ncbi:MAG: molybdopterin-dependent oxidoreductase [Coriobacteriaceae bacterium]|jgi:anaerobic dimethyl sulfoxide reductase subunit A|nr:molybdopterin-dependent oxidoreductase [Coriobacteriaceae bacterium]
MEGKGRITEGMTRRGFVAAAAAASALAALGNAGCSPSQNSVVKKDHATPPDPTEGEWVTAACWHNCGGRCLNKALVKDGIIVRQKTDDTHEDSYEQFQQRACVRGRAQRNQVLSADRIRKPLKRAGWAPGGGAASNGQMRGKDEWEEIEWDEALSLIAQEFDRIKAAYGNKAFFINGSEAQQLMAAYGGFVNNWGTTSYGAFAYTPGICGFGGFNLSDNGNDRLDFKNCEVIVLIGSNPAWSSGGSPIYHALLCKEGGTKFVAFDPFYNESHSALEAEWIPTRPGTETALFLGIAHEMLRMDAEKKLIDWDFLNKYTIGFDAEHMPEGEDPQGNFKDYVLGTYDKTPKTPQWASVRCGVAPEKISAVAELIGKDTKAAVVGSYAAARNTHVDNWPQMLMTIGAMGGHYGKSGHMCGLTTNARAYNGGSTIFQAGSSGLKSIENPIKDEALCHVEMWRGILTGSYNYTGSSSSKRNPGVKKDIDIHVIWHGGGARLQTADDQVTGIKAHRKVDLVISNASFLTTNSKYADFILPVSTLWERDGGFLTGNREMLIMYSRVLDRYFETYSDQEIVMMLAPKLGIDPLTIYPIDEKQQFFNQAAGATMINDKGEKVPLISFTQAEIDALKVEGKPQDGFISFTEFKEKGVVSVKRKEGDAYTYYFGKDFIEDPVANPMTSESGLMEIYCRKLAASCKSFGFSSDVTPIPTYYTGPEGYPGTFAGGDIEAGKPSKYPFQLYNPHYLRRVHSVMDNVQWLREAWVNPVYLNAQDASAKQIKTGDTVKITSPYASCLRTACVTERLMPGVVGLPHGAWVDVDEATGIDKAGSDNYLYGCVVSGAGVSGWNSGICTFEKAAEELAPDIDRPLLVSYEENGDYAGKGM